MVFEKLKLEGFAGHDDVRLKTSLRVPKVVVGRIIGKAGKNVRELQRVTGAMVKLPEDPTTQGDEVIVEVFGNFMAIQVGAPGLSCTQIHLLTLAPSKSFVCLLNNFPAYFFPFSFISLSATLRIGPFHFHTRSWLLCVVSIFL